MAKALFLDRDGVINRPPKAGLYITSVEEFEILPGVLEAIAEARRSDFQVFVVTNQRCIATGLVSEQTIHAIHEKLLRELNAGITRIYVCPHDDADACDCRKPKPGMLRQAAKDYSLDLSQSWMVGDSECDIAAGRVAGCRTVFIGRTRSADADFTADDLREAVQKIVSTN